MKITQSRLKSILNYNEYTGHFTWIASKGNNAKKGAIAGGINKGYRRIIVDGVSYQAHRLIWLYMYGAFPKHHIDHINHNRSDNRLVNIREVTSAGNNKNLGLRKDNSSGVTGVRWRKQRNKWVAHIVVSKKQISLGHFDNKNEAICARLHANRLYKFHANHGKSNHKGN